MKRRSFFSTCLGILAAPLALVRPAAAETEKSAKPDPLPARLWTEKYETDVPKAALILLGAVNKVRFRGGPAGHVQIVNAYLGRTGSFMQAIPKPTWTVEFTFCETKRPWNEFRLGWMQDGRFVMRTILWRGKHPTADFDAAFSKMTRIE